MWLWWYSLCINLFLWLKYASVNKFICLIPLAVLVLYASYDLYASCNEKEFDLLLLGISITIIVLVLITDQIFMYFSICLCVLIFIYMVKKGKDIFIYPPKMIRIANAISFICSIFTYITIYAAMENEIDNVIPLIPFFLCVITEVFITWKVYYGKIEELNDEFCKLIVYNRILFSLSTSAIFIIAIFYVYNLVDSVYIFSISTILYAIGLIIDNMNMFKKIKCKPLYRQLQNDNINVNSDQTNGRISMG